MISFHLIKGCFSQRNYWTKSSKWWSCVCLLCLSLSCVWCSQFSHCLWVIISDYPYCFLSHLFLISHSCDTSLYCYSIVVTPTYYDTTIYRHSFVPTSHFTWADIMSLCTFSIFFQLSLLFITFEAWSNVCYL